MSVRDLIRRWIKFNFVGAMGICVQLVAVYLLGSILALNSFCATALAAELAVLHNFLWHQRFTWRDRRDATRRVVYRRLLVFNATTGAMSIGSNLLVVSLLMREFHAPLLLANLCAVGACSVANFVTSNVVIFRIKSHPEISTLRCSLFSSRFSRYSLHGGIFAP